MILGFYNKSVWLTLLGSAIAVGGLSLAMDQRVRDALICLVLAGIIDLFDGAVARRIQRSEAEKAFGVQLDSLADMLSFTALPLAISLSLGIGRLPQQWFLFPLLILYAVAAIQRLGYFNVLPLIRSNGSEEAAGSYRGLPVTYSALILTWGWLLLSRFAADYILPGMAAILGVTALFFILDVPVRKPRGLAYPFFIVLAIVTVVLLGLMPV